jgi:nitroreductase
MLEMLRKRRSIRRFEPRAISIEIRRTLEEALLRSPTSRNRRPWRFVFVDDRQTLVQLSDCKPHSSEFVSEAPLVVVIAANEAECDVWIEDCSIAAITLQYAAQNLGLGSCWVQVRLRGHDGEAGAEAHVRNCLGIPAEYRVGAMVALGHPAEKKRGVPGSALDRSKIHYGRFGNPACTEH